MEQVKCVTSCQTNRQLKIICILGYCSSEVAGAMVRPRPAPPRPARLSLNIQELERRHCALQLHAACILAEIGHRSLLCLCSLPAIASLDFGSLQSQIVATAGIRQDCAEILAEDSCQSVLDGRGQQVQGWTHVQASPCYIRVSMTWCGLSRSPWGLRQ